MSRLRIAQLNATDATGGAARAACRLHAGLNAAGHDSSLLVRERSGSAGRVHRMEPDGRFFFGLRDAILVERGYIAPRRAPHTNTLFSYPWPGYTVTQYIDPSTTDVINLHWNRLFVDPDGVAGLARTGVPVVWTFHDTNPMTGGCHYPAGCTGYLTDCADCPQLSGDPCNLAASVLRDKHERWTDHSFTVAAPSRWMANVAGESLLFKNARIEVLPNGVETDVFSPRERRIVRQKLGWPLDAVVFLFGAVSAGETRKGFADIVRATSAALGDARFSEKARAGGVIIAGFGHASPELENLPLSVMNLGSINDDDLLADIYAAADAFVLPSLEDNLPNTMLESMASGTPVIAYDTGGVPDAVIDGKTGLLVKTGDADALGGALVRIATGDIDPAVLGRSARELVEKEFSIQRMVERYVSVYRDLSRTSPVAYNKPAAHTDRALPCLHRHAMTERLGRLSGIPGVVPLGIAASRLVPWGTLYRSVLVLRRIKRAVKRRRT